MPKLKPLSQLADDAKSGDLIRFTFRGDRETTIYLKEFKNDFFILTYLYPSTEATKLKTINNSGIFRDYMSHDRGLDVTGYEILRRHKKKSSN